MVNGLERWIVVASRSGTGALFLLFSFRPLAFLVSGTVVTPVEMSTLKGRAGGQMRRDKGKREGRIRTNLSAIGKDRANPRTTRRWTTWRHVVGLSWTPRPRSGGEETRGEAPSSAERSLLDLVFSELEGREHGFYKAFSLVRYSESALARARFARPADRRVASVAALKRRVFAPSRSDIAN